MNAVIEASGLGKRYGRRQALADCTLAVPGGRVTGLVGLNGAGKTTLLHLAAGMIDPTAGEIRVLGERPVGTPAQLARFGFVAQDAPVYAGLSVAGHLRMGAWLNPGWDSELAVRRIERLGLDPRQRAGSLSGGQRAQLALMIRFAWIRFRTQAAVGAGVLAVAACTRQGNCAATLGSGLRGAFPSQGDLNAVDSLNALGLAVPALIGMFWGAPLIARELETGTFRLAWTQGVTRVRWLAAKLGVAGVAAVAAGELFSLMVNWWSSPVRKAQMASGVASGISHSGITPAGCTLPAMFVTLVIYTAVIIAFPAWVRPHLIPPVQATVALPVSSGVNMDITNNMLQPQTFGGAPDDRGVPAGSWILSTGLVVNAEGRPVYSVPPRLQRAGPGLRGIADGTVLPGVRLLRREPAPPADGDLPAREPLLGLRVDRDRDLPRPGPSPGRTLLPADPPPSLRGTRHPPPQPAGPRARKVRVTLGDPESQPPARRRSR